MFIPQAQQIQATWSGGTTHTICFYPPESNASTGNYVFWVNIATIEHTARYSYFPGYQRLHLILNDPGLILQFQSPDQVTKLGQFEAHHFDGARPVEATPIADDALAFNVVMQHGIQAKTRLITATESTLPSTWLDTPGESQMVHYIFYGVRGQFVITLDEQVWLNVGDAYLVTPEHQSKLGARRAIFRTSSPDAIGLVCKIISPAEISP
ncbi:MAG: HutD family protein [Chloroflexota bacterium]